MSIKISFKKNISIGLIKNYALFTNEDFKINGLDKLILNKSSKEIYKTVQSNFQKNKDFLSFNLNPLQKIILIKIKKNHTSLDNEKKGANFFDFLSRYFYNLF